MIITVNMFCVIVGDIVVGKDNGGLIVSKDEDCNEIMFELLSELNQPYSSCCCE